jgi:hypothetical protein
MGSPSRMQRASNPLHPSPPSPQRKQGNAGSRVARHRRAGRSLVATAFSPSTTYDSPFLRRSKNPNAPRASADPGSVSDRMASCHADPRGRAPRTPKRAVSTKNTTSCRFFLANAVCWCWAWHPAMPIYEGGLPEHRSELYSRKTRHRVVFSWQTQFAGAGHGILPCRSTRAGSPNTEASIRRLGAARAPSSPTQSPSRRASEACSGSPLGCPTG